MRGGGAEVSQLFPRGKGGEKNLLAYHSFFLVRFARVSREKGGPPFDVKGDEKKKKGKKREKEGNLSFDYRRLTFHGKRRGKEKRELHTFSTFIFS